MATLEAVRSDKIREHLEQLDDAGLLAQQLVQRGAIFAVTCILRVDCDKAYAAGMLESLIANQKLLEEIATARGVTKIEAAEIPGLH